MILFKISQILIIGILVVFFTLLSLALISAGFVALITGKTKNYFAKYRRYNFTKKSSADTYELYEYTGLTARLFGVIFTVVGLFIIGIIIFAFLSLTV